MSSNLKRMAYMQKTSPDTTNDRLKIDYTTILRDRAIRAVEVLISLIGIVLTLPIWLLIALIIKIDSPGPVIFKQIRIGKDRRGGKDQISENGGGLCCKQRGIDLGGRPFTFYKFRTMDVDARKKFPELYQYDYNQEEIKTLQFKIAGDPRLTRFGQHLRKTTLDELPNFINVLKGDMSIVGPRPELPEMIKYYQGEQRTKFQVKPGITGPSQVNGRGLLNFQTSQRIDIEYAKNKTLWLDCKIVMKTFKVTFSRIGAF